MTTIVRSLVLGLALVPTSHAVAQPTAPDPVRQEEARRAVELALADLTLQGRGDIDVDRFVSVAFEFVRRGPEVVPALAAELDQTLPSSFFFCAYALGLIGGPQAAAALESAIARAEADTGDFALNRKGWACHALGLLGRVDALDKLIEGRWAAGIPVHAGMSALEAVAVLTAPAGLPRLFAQLDRYDDAADPNGAQRVQVLEAIARIIDPSAIPVLEKVLESPRVGLRHHAARALGSLGSPEATQILLGALADPDAFVRTGVAIGLRSAPPVADIDRILDRLDVEEDAVVRGELYRFVALYGSAEQHERLVAHWGRPQPDDRRLLLRALADAPAAVALPVLSHGLADRDPSVAVVAAVSLERLGDPRAVDLLAPRVASEEWSPAQAAVDALAGLGDPRGAAPILKRLLDTELTRRITDPRQRLRIEKLLLAVVELRDTSRLVELATARDGASDVQVRGLLARHVARLTAIAEAGDKAKRWISALDSPSADVRDLAYAALGRLGGEASARALVERFGRVDPAEAREIVRALGSIPGKAARDLLRRVLVDPAFDPIEHSELRSMAAWSARRIGGAAMLDALREAVERREGRDGYPFVYLTVLGGAGTVPDIDRLRVPRLRYLGSSRGIEDERLQWIRRELRAGRSISAVDVPPEQLELR